MTKLLKITQTEIELLEAFKECVNDGERKKKRIYKRTAWKLKIAESTVRSRLSRLRTKYELTIKLRRDLASWQQTFFQKTGGKFNPLGRSGKGINNSKSQ